MRWFFILICLFSINAYAQSDLVKIDTIKGCECSGIGKDIGKINEAKKIVAKGEIRGILKACYVHCIGVGYHNSGNYIEAIKFNKKTLSLRQKYHRAFVWKSQYMLGLSFKALGTLDKSKDYFLEAHFDNEAIKRPKDSTNIPRMLAQAFTNMGEFQQAEQYAWQATEAYQTSKLYQGHAYNTLSTTFGAQQQSVDNQKLAVQYADTAIRLYQQSNSKNKKTYIARALNNKANALSWLTHYEKAINTYQLILDIYRENAEPYAYAEVLNNMGSDLAKKGDIKAGIDTLNKSLEIKKDVLNKTHAYTYAFNYENLGEIYVQMEDYNKALLYFQLAIDNLKDKPKSKAPYIYNKPGLLRVLDLKAQAAFKSGNTNLAHNTYQVLDEWTNEFYKDLSTNESKLTWIARAHDTYANAIEVALTKKDNEKAFQYAEKAHAVLLWQSLSQQAARNLLSEKDKEKIDNLTTQIRQADQQYRNGDIEIDALRTLERERETLEKTFDEQYPDYAQRKYQPEATTVSDIQSNIIDDQTAFIEYYRTDEVLYIFTITKNGLEITQKNAAGLADDITDFVKNISRENMDTENYHTLAHKLYELLIPSAIHSNDKITRLVIVPDREIGTLPFAALATQATSGKLNKNTPFLLKKYTTNYLYSAGSYLQLQQKPANQKYCFAGIAPVEYQVGDWKKLAYSEQELEGIKPLHWSWQREILTKEAATKAEFERIIQEGYRTIQVSTHAVFDKNKGQIIFYDGIITQGEIDQLEINTHRLILSACETGVGIQNQGEGILSLGWNFAYKGVPSITMTHWSVSDNSTKDIMIRYHENLNDSTPADQALQNAQQYYLENIISDVQAIPYYWAAIFHTGNVR